jgi:hypothetical protein
MIAVKSRFQRLHVNGLHASYIFQQCSQGLIQGAGNPFLKIFGNRCGPSIRYPPPPSLDVTHIMDLGSLHQTLSGRNWTVELSIWLQLTGTTVVTMPS